MAFVELAKQQIRPLLQLNDELRKLAAAERDINVTSIVAVGDQSHGKTSVIEALSGVDLPRGEGIQTRVPLVLMLRASKPDGPEFAMIKDGEGNYDEEKLELKEIADAVQRWTSKLAGDSKDVVDSPLELTVYRHDQDDLTLIDLPGMTRVAINGQHEKIEQTITQMYEHYMAPAETVLLNVVSCMVDFTTSKSLQLSRELDPEGSRTLLCVTKVDQHSDSGLLAKVFKAGDDFHCPVFCVRNRSQPENDQEVPLAKAREVEHEFFQTHDELCGLPENNRGVAALSSCLVTLQTQRIKATLPEVAEKIKKRVAELEGQITRFGPQLKSDAEARALVQQRVQQGLRDLEDELSGQVQRDSPELGPGSRAQLKLDLSKDVTALDQEYDKTVLQEIAGAVGFKLQVNLQHEDKSKCIFFGARILDVERVESCSVFFVFKCDGVETSVEHTRTAAEAHGNTLYGGTHQPTPKAVGPMTLTAVVQDVVFKNQPESDLLCAVLDKKQTEFNDEVHGLYPNQYFFSDGLRSLVQKEAAARRGAAGMPNCSAPDVPLSVLRDLRRGLPELLNGLVKQVHAAVHDACKRLLVAQFDGQPSVRKAVDEAVCILLKQQLDLAHNRLHELLDWEATVCTTNHYFMDTVQDLRKHLLATPPPRTSTESSRFSFLESSDVTRLRGLSNEHQRLLDIQIEVFAYWKTMKKRLIDYAILATRSYLARKPIVEGKLRKAVFGAIEAAAQTQGAGSVLALVAPSKDTQSRLQELQKRLCDLNQAQQKLAQQLHAS